MRRHRDPIQISVDYICGICGRTGADKIPAPRQWPGEADPDQPYVHQKCEVEECKRAHEEFLSTHTEDQVWKYITK